MNKEKAVLRDHFRAQRLSLSAGVRERLTAAALVHVLALPELAGARRVALYAVLEREAELDPRGLDAALRARGVDLVYPRVERRQAPLAFVPVRDVATLVPGSFGVPEPAGSPVPLASIDVVVVPALAFDRSGYRLGYGAGFYDRTLVAFPGVSVGLGFSMQVVEALPRAGHDRPVTYVVTDAGALECARDLCAPAT